MGHLRWHRLLCGAQYAAVAVGALWVAIALATGQPLLSAAGTWLVALTLFIRLLEHNTLTLVPAPCPPRAQVTYHVDEGYLGLGPLHVRALEELLGRRLDTHDEDRPAR
jgi:hypothetical protein